MRYLILAVALFLGVNAHAQNVTCATNDFSCRVQHNDSAALGTKLDLLHTDLQALLKQLQSSSTVATTTPPATTTPTTPAANVPADAVTAFDPCGSITGKWSILKITPSVNINNALVCASPNAKLLLEAGTYNQVFHVPDGALSELSGDTAAGANADNVILSGRGGCTVDQNNAGGCATRLAWGKGVIHVSSPIWIHDLQVIQGGSNASGNHDGQAGIYIDGGAAATGKVTIQHVMMRNNENGAFANGASNNMDMEFIECDFVGNGTDGGSHSAYISGGKSLTLTNIHDYGSNLGNNQKSRVPKVTATGGFYKSIQGRWIECADGCVLSITGGTYVGNTCCQNVFGNGTESTSKGPGNTTWTGSTIWLGRQSNFANAGGFAASSITVSCAAGAYASNDHGGDLTGLPTCPANSNASDPADAPFISGAKS